MAEMVVSIVKNHLLPLAQEELKLIANVDAKIHELAGHYIEIQNTLKSMEERQHEEPVNQWLTELKSVSYGVDDVIDQWRTGIHRPNIVNCFSFIQPIARNTRTDFFLDVLTQNNFLHRCWVRYNVGHQIDSLEKRLQDLKKNPEFKQARIEEAYQGRQESSSSQNNYDSQFFPLKEDDNKDPKEFFAREGDKKDIITALEDRNQKSIISITGIDGIGKTTLARHVFDDPKVQSHFETLIWVKVPKPFNCAKLPQCTKIQQTPKEKNTLSELADLTEHVNEKLVLVVLDDAREDYDDNSWSALVTELKKAANGSKFLVTSPRKEVAHQMKSNLDCKVDEHELKNLPPEDSLSLFSNILRNMEKKLLEEVKGLSEKIVRRCDGFPLTIKAVGRHLITKTSRHDWQIVSDSNAWEAEAVEKKVYPALKICYSELPPHLKSCFAYCAIFNEGDTIDTDDLVNLWMAQGLVPDSPDYPEVEAIGEVYVSELKGHSFFEVVEGDKDGKTISLSIHNTIHRFARYITNQELAVKKIHRAENFIMKTFCNRYHLLRHLTLLCPPDDESKVFPSLVYKAKGLRTLRVQPIGSKSKLGKAPPEDIFSRLTRLRALDLSKSDIKQLPDKVDKLIHLRYLNLSETNLETLPEKVCNLYNLQTLGLKKCKELVELPRGMRKMKNLRHLEISQTRALKRLPQGIGKLTSLRRLSKFIVDGECKIGELKKLDSLRGCLEIKGIEKVAKGEAKEAEMHNKEHLHKLKLEFPKNGQTDDKTLEEIIEGLTPHPNLKELVISNYHGTNFPNFLMTQTKLELKVLRLLNFKNCTQLSPRGKLKQLTELEMTGMKELMNIDHKFFETMPQLSSLKLTDCPNLKGLLCHLHRPILEELIINNCPKLEWPASLPLELPELKELSLTDNAGVLTESLSQTRVHLPKLKSLWINGSPYSSLPQGLGQLQELRTLELTCCTEIDSLPDELRNLKLQELRVNTCPKLRSRCQKEDWDKISCIHNIIIDYKKIDQDRSLREKGAAVKKKAVVESVQAYSRALIDGFEEIFW